MANRAADDLLERASLELRLAVIPQMPADLLGKATAVIEAAGPEPSYEKPPKPSVLVPFIAVLVLIVAVVTAATWDYIRPKPPAFAFSEVAAKLVELKSAEYRVLRTYTDQHGVQRRVESQVTVADSKLLREVQDRHSDGRLG